ncbi:MAG TPA: hypothetical protein VFM46_04925, partial [Pseudomonadales bacterium]|nr:hypothetical protein [Pseudomonadales bacterium]
MPIVIPLFYVSIGIIIFNIVQSAAIGISGHRRLLYFTLSACGMVFVVFQYSVVRLYLAESISEASSALRWQMGAATLFMPLFYCVISAYTEQQRLNPGLTILALIYALLFLLNLNSPYSLRYDSLQSAEPLVLPWGEQLAFYSGELSTKNILARLVNTAVNLYLFVPMLKMYKQGRRRAALVLVICNILFILTSGLGALIDAGTIKFIYGVGFTYLIFAALITMSLGMDIRENNIRISLTSKQLQHEVEQREEIEYAIRQIAHSASSQIGENYFRRLVSILADLFDSQHALIGTYNEKEGTISTLALLHNGKLVNNISFAVNGSPAAHVLEYGSFYSKNTMSRLFPKAKYLADLDVSSYLGVALKNNEGTKLGVLELLSSRPIFKAAMAEEI